MTGRGTSTAETLDKDDSQDRVTERDFVTLLTKNSMQFKMYELFISGICHVIVDHGWLWVIEILERKTTDRGWGTAASYFLCTHHSLLLGLLVKKTLYPLSVLTVPISAPYFGLLVCTFQITAYFIQFFHFVFILAIVFLTFENFKFSECSFFMAICFYFFPPTPSPIR